MERQLIIIPAYKPSDNLVDFCRELGRYFEHIIVVDDGSGSEYKIIFDEVGLEASGTHLLYFLWIREFYKNIGLNISFEKVPIISMLFSIGFQFWIVLNSVFYVGYRKCRHLYLPLAIILGYTIISAFVPLVLLRYFAMLFLAFPMTVVFTIQSSLIIGE